MSWRVVVVSRRCKLEYKLGYLVCRGEETKKIFISEIGVLIIESTGVALTTALFDKLNAESDCPIDYNEESGVQELFKAFGVCVRKEETLLENLLLFVRAHAFLLKTRCFFFVNLKTVLTEKQLKDFYHETELAEICVFLLENTCKPKLPGETVTVIDRDLCEFLA